MHYILRVPFQTKNKKTWTPELSYAFRDLIILHGFKQSIKP